MQADYFHLIQALRGFTFSGRETHELQSKRKPLSTREGLAHECRTSRLGAQL